MIHPRTRAHDADGPVRDALKAWWKGNYLTLDPNDLIGCVGAAFAAGMEAASHPDDPRMVDGDPAVIVQRFEPDGHPGAGCRDGGAAMAPALHGVRIGPDDRPTLTLAVNGSEYRTQATEVRGKLGGCPITAIWDGRADMRIEIDTGGQTPPRVPLPIIYGTSNADAYATMRADPVAHLEGLRDVAYRDFPAYTADAIGLVLARLAEAEALIADVTPAIGFVNDLASLTDGEIEGTTVEWVRSLARSNLHPGGFARFYSDEQREAAAMGIMRHQPHLPMIHDERLRLVDRVARALGLMRMEPGA